MLFFKAVARGWQISGVNQSDRAFPKDGGLDQRGQQRLVDLAKSHDPHTVAKGVEDTRIGHFMPVPQSGKGAPSPLLGEHGRQQIERMHRRYKRQQMHAPELGGTELPARTASGAAVPMVVDEVIRNIRIKYGEQLVGARHR